MNTKIITSIIREITSDFKTEDSKLGTDQHVTPAALLKQFKTIPADLRFSAIDYYNLKMGSDTYSLDDADKFLTHIESNCFSAIGELVSKSLKPSKDEDLASLLICSSRRNVRAKYLALFYLYCATLYTRSPWFRYEVTLDTSEYIKGWVSLNTGINHDKLNFKDLAVKQFASLSPYMIEMLACTLSKKAVTLYISNGAYNLGTSLAGHLLKSKQKTSLKQQDFLFVLSDSLAVVLETPQRAGSNCSIRKANLGQISSINTCLDTWNRPL